MTIKPTHYFELGLAILRVKWVPNRNNTLVTGIIKWRLQRVARTVLALKLNIAIYGKKQEERSEYFAALSNTCIFYFFTGAQTR